MKIILQLYWA